MSSKPRNSLAFPRVTGKDYAPQLGMTLRDYFAGQTLVGLLSDTNVRDTPEAMARNSYLVADAMLKEREATND